MEKYGNVIREAKGVSRELVDAYGQITVGAMAVDKLLKSLVGVSRVGRCKTAEFHIEDLTAAVAYLVIFMQSIARGTEHESNNDEATVKALSNTNGIGDMSTDAMQRYLLQLVEHVGRFSGEVARTCSITLAHTIIGNISSLCKHFSDEWLFERLLENQICRIGTLAVYKSDKLDKEELICHRKQ